MRMMLGVLLAVTLVLTGCGGKSSSIPTPSDAAVARAIRAFNRDALTPGHYRRVGGDLDGGYELADDGARVKMQIGDSYDVRFTKKLGGFIADYPLEVYSAMFTGENPGGRSSDQFNTTVAPDSDVPYHGAICVNFTEAHVIRNFHHCYLSSP